MTEKQMLISAIVFLATTIAGMATYIVKLHANQSKELKELIINNITALVKVCDTMENHNKLIEKFLK